MPEYPDIENYVEALRDRISGSELLSWHFLHPFLLRTVEPSPESFLGLEAGSVTRRGKRIVIGFEKDLYAAIHLMIGGRLHWKEAEPAENTAALRKRGGTLFLARFSTGTLSFTEAGTKRRASIHLAHGTAALDALDPGGLELFDTTLEEFAGRLRSANHTVKRSLTDPRLFSGIGNAYSDEILHAARMSPFLQTSRMDDGQIAELFDACRNVLAGWKNRLTEERKGQFPRKVTAFHAQMAVHGKYGKPCPVCGTPVQRIRYADNESNYCPRCQTGGTVYADRALSRLLKDDWPRSVEELENLPGRSS